MLLTTAPESDPLGARRRRLATALPPTAINSIAFRVRADEAGPMFTRRCAAS
ncbi:MAG: hypothetical protein AB7K09_17695 [Planctomycetota bacterium]